MNSLKSNIVSIRSRDVLDCRRADLTITSFSLLFILYMTLFPFDFLFRETYSNLGYHFLLLGWGKSDILDVQGNVLLFIPLGFGLTGFLMKIIRLPKLHSLLVIILMSFLLSYSIEVFQVFQSSRFPSLIDVFSNGVGGLFGFLCFSLYEHKVKTNYINRLIVLFGYLFCIKYFSMTSTFSLPRYLHHLLR